MRCSAQQLLCIERLQGLLWGRTSCTALILPQYPFKRLCNKPRPTPACLQKRLRLLSEPAPQAAAADRKKNKAK